MWRSQTFENEILTCFEILKSFPYTKKYLKKTTVALCGTILKPSKIEVQLFCRFFFWNREKKHWHYVALSCNLHKLNFGTFHRFLGKCENTAVALCGTMWRYPKTFESWILALFILFSENVKKRLWHYVALCGTILKPSKVEFWHFSSFSWKMWKNGCGTRALQASILTNRDSYQHKFLPAQILTNKVL